MFVFKYTLHLVWGSNDVRKKRWCVIWDTLYRVSFMNDTSERGPMGIYVILCFRVLRLDFLTLPLLPVYIPSDNLRSFPWPNPLSNGMGFWNQNFDPKDNDFYHLEKKFYGAMFPFPPFLYSYFYTKGKNYISNYIRRKFL